MFGSDCVRIDGGLASIDQAMIGVTNDIPAMRDAR
jgi:hypothetical protein